MQKAAPIADPPDAPEPRAEKVARPARIRKKSTQSRGTDQLRIRVNKSVNLPK